MRRLVPFVLALLIAVIAGCGSHDDYAPPAPAVPLPRYGTVAALTKATGDKHLLDQAVRFRVTGVSNGDTPQNLAGEGSMRFQSNAVLMQVGLHLQRVGAPRGPEFTLVTLPEGIYLKLPDQAASMMPPGKSWFRIVNNGSSPAMTAFYQAAQSLRQNADPSQGFSQLGGATSIADSDQELLDNIWTVRYEINMDFTKAATLSPDPAMQGALLQLVQLGAPPDNTTLWLDRQNRVLRTVLRRSFAAPNGGITTYTLTMRFLGWGDPVQVNPPPREQVVSN
jgi:hypothetical protein